MTEEIETPKPDAVAGRLDGLVMRCGACKHWSKDTDGDYPEHFALGKCKRVRLFWNCTEWGDLPDGSYGRRLTKEAEGNHAFVQDGSDYRAELITRHEFGCVQFEPHNAAHEPTANNQQGD